LLFFRNGVKGVIVEVQQNAPNVLWNEFNQANGGIKVPVQRGIEIFVFGSQPVVTELQIFIGQDSTNAEWCLSFSDLDMSTIEVSCCCIAVNSILDFGKKVFWGA